LGGGGFNHHSRNVCIFAEGEVDRSLTGTGVARAHSLRRDCNSPENYD
jgi:trans-L-3-hydroxyproline dehydratase